MADTSDPIRQKDKQFGDNNEHSNPMGFFRLTEINDL